MCDYQGAGLSETVTKAFLGDILRAGGFGSVTCTYTDLFAQDQRNRAGVTWARAQLASKTKSQFYRWLAIYKGNPEKWSKILSKFSSLPPTAPSQQQLPELPTTAEVESPPSLLSPSFAYPSQSRRPPVASPSPARKMTALTPIRVAYNSGDYSPFDVDLSRPASNPIFMIRKNTEVVHQGLLVHEVVIETKDTGLAIEDIAANAYQAHMIQTKDGSEIIMSLPAIPHSYYHDMSPEVDDKDGTVSERPFTEQQRTRDVFCPRDEESRQVLINSIDQKARPSVNYVVLRFPGTGNLSNKFHSPDSEVHEGPVKLQIQYWWPYESIKKPHPHDSSKDEHHSRFKVMLQWKVAIHEDTYRIAKKATTTLSVNAGVEALNATFGAGLHFGAAADLQRREAQDQRKQEEYCRRIEEEKCRQIAQEKEQEIRRKQQSEYKELVRQRVEQQYIAQEEQRIAAMKKQEQEQQQRIAAAANKERREPASPKELDFGATKATRMGDIQELRKKKQDAKKEKIRNQTLSSPLVARITSLQAAAMFTKKPYSASLINPDNQEQWDSGIWAAAGDASMTGVTSEEGDYDFDSEDE